jgi:hypothetical protein
MRQSTCRCVYLTDSDHADELPGFHAAFSASLLQRPGWRHQKDLLPALQFWRDLKGHPETEGFFQAARKEYDDLQHWGTFTVVPKPPNTKLLPPLWVLT